MPAKPPAPPSRPPINGTLWGAGKGGRVAKRQNRLDLTAVAEGGIEDRHGAINFVPADGQGRGDPKYSG